MSPVERKESIMHLSIKHLVAGALLVGALSVTHDTLAYDCDDYQVWDTCHNAPPPVWVNGKCLGAACSIQVVQSCKDIVVECHAWGCPNVICTQYSFDVCDPKSCGGGSCGS